LGDPAAGTAPALRLVKEGGREEGREGGVCETVTTRH